ncbi:hypothetical protein KXR63_15090 [Stutzerimonas chloritidismutans]
MTLKNRIVMAPMTRARRRPMTSPTNWWPWIIGSAPAPV